MTQSKPVAIYAKDAEVQTGSSYPDPFKKEVSRRSKQVLGDLFGLTHYGVNLVELPSGEWSSQRHWHTREDEFVYVLSGELTLVTDEGKEMLTVGMVAGFPAGNSNGHHLINESDSVASYLEIGDRISDDEVNYPDIDLRLMLDGEGRHVFAHRDDKPYDQD